MCANYSECYPPFCVQEIGLIHANNTAVLEKSGREKDEGMTLNLKIVSNDELNVLKVQNI